MRSGAVVETVSDSPEVWGWVRRYASRHPCFNVTETDAMGQPIPADEAAYRERERQKTKSKNEALVKQGLFFFNSELQMVTVKIRVFLLKKDPTAPRHPPEAGRAQLERARVQR